ncbi:MAG TPA: hypothetical protein VF165_02285 [Nocardioidaceae bacterium]
MIRLRNPFTYAIGLALSLGLGAALCWVMWDPGVDHSLVSRVTAGLVVGANIWFIWRVAGHPAVLVSDAGVLVRNPFRRHVVPWILLGEVTVSDGLRFTVGGRESIRAWAFSGSVIGEVTGNWSATRAQLTIDSARQGIAPPSGGQPESRLDLGLRSLLLMWSGALLLAVATWAMDPESPAIAVPGR